MVKRIFDIMLSLGLLIIFAPVIFIVGIIIKYKLGSPILFKQQRPGLNGQPFFLIKFRSMTDMRDREGNLLSDHQRLTPIGSFLRKYSIDELPQLLNVIKGELSLVGPRPLLMEYLPFYSEHQARRHLVKPGITGWAQINGRNLISWEEKFELDIWYVENQTFFLDIKILILTVIKVLRHEGINQTEQLTMPPFLGTNPKEKVEHG